MTMSISRSLALAASSAIGATLGCGSDSQEASKLSWQAIAATLATQESIEFEEEAAVEFQRQAIDRCWSLEPLLKCVNPVPPWDLGVLLTLAVPPDIEAAWEQGTLISSNETMNRLVDEFQMVGVSTLGPGKYEIRFAPTPIEADAYRSWEEVTLLRMDRLAERLNQEVEGLETMTESVPLRGLASKITWSQGSSSQLVRWEWAGQTADGLGTTFWDCRVPDDPEREVDLQISGDALSYDAIDQCIEYIEEGISPI